MNMSNDYPRMLAAWSKITQLLGEKKLDATTVALGLESLANGSGTRVHTVLRDTAEETEKFLSRIRLLQKTLHTPDAPDNILDRPVSDLNLSVRARKTTIYLGVKTVRELVQKKSQQLLDIKNCGPTTLREIQEKLHAYDLKLAD